MSPKKQTGKGLWMVKAQEEQIKTAMCYDNPTEVKVFVDKERRGLQLDDKISLNKALVDRFKIMKENQGNEKPSGPSKASKGLKFSTPQKGALEVSLHKMDQASRVGM
jgi:hypothetical protein